MAFDRGPAVWETAINSAPTLQTRSHANAFIRASIFTMGLGEIYAAAIRQAEASGTNAEPEAQLTIPVANLFVELASEEHLGQLRLMREAQLEGVRPDFAATINGRACGWVELKAPGHTLDGDLWTGRERRQWALLSELDSLIVTDGRTARLYLAGQPALDAPMPWNGEADWDRASLVALIEAFIASRPAIVTTASDLASRLASLTGLLRDRLLAGLTPGTTSQPVQHALEAWKRDVHEGVDNASFASDVAQVIAYSLAIAALSGHADRDMDGYISLDEAREALRGQHALLAAALGPVLGVQGLTESIRAELGAIERLVSSIDSGRIAKAKDHRGEPWLWFYEDFLARYDPVARRKAGVYYTPVSVVEYQARQAQSILHEVFDKPLGFGDRTVVTLDPATGSGTYPLAIIDLAAANALERRGAAGPKQAAQNLAENLIAFEILPGPYSVAHLRIGQRLAEIEGAAVPTHTIRTYLTDTLADPSSQVAIAPGLWGDAETLATERSRAAAVKRDETITVIIGNPPYARRTGESGGGWVVHPTTGRSLFDDLLDGARSHGVIFSAQASLYNDYVYFWRWAIWKALEQTSKPAIISFITASSWLAGPGFVGLRALAQTLGDAIWVTDLGGENRGAVTEENVFAIQTPVAIVTVYRKQKSKTDVPAKVLYRRVRGTRAEKLAQLDELNFPIEDDTGWEIIAAGFGDPFIPVYSDASWSTFPLLTDLFPWQQPGAKFNRAWPIAVTPELLKERWRILVDEADLVRRSQLFVTAATGRTIHTSVAGLARLADLGPEAPHRPIVRYTYRPFDRQWTFEDPRLANLERPALWRSRSSKQLFLIGMLTRTFGSGPALVASANVPDMHAFQGSYGGKDVIPLYRDAAATTPNVTSGLLDVLSNAFGSAVTPEDLAAYVFAVTSHQGYRSKFATQLESPGIRVPMSADASLFFGAAAIGKRLLCLQTFGERFVAAGAPHAISRDHSIEWLEPVDQLPDGPDNLDFNPSTRTLVVGTGVIGGVLPAVWEYTVSGFPVVQRWFQARTRSGVGRAASARATPLDRVRPTTWADEWNDEALELLTVVTETLQTAPTQQELLESILNGPLFSVDELPAPTPGSRAVPTLTGLELEIPDVGE